MYNDPSLYSHNCLYRHRILHLVINQRTPIFLPSSHPIPDDAKDYHTSGNNHTVIHSLCIHSHDWWPQTPEDHENHINTCVCIVDNSQYAWKTPWSPDQLCLYDAFPSVMVPSHTSLDEPNGSASRPETQITDSVSRRFPPNGRQRITAKGLADGDRKSVV